MSDRYSTITREVPVERERNRVFVPGSVDPRFDESPVTDLSSQHRVSLHPAGFRVRERGALEGTVVHAYRCPVHGLVDVRVPRSDVPDVVPCPEEVFGPLLHQVPVFQPEQWLTCEHAATWAGSQCGQGWAAGECKS